MVQREVRDDRDRLFRVRVYIGTGARARVLIVVGASVARFAVAADGRSERLGRRLRRPAAPSSRRESRDEGVDGVEPRRERRAGGGRSREAAERVRGGGEGVVE